MEVVGTHHRSSLDIRAAVAAVVALGDEDSLVVVVLVDILAVDAAGFQHRNHVVDADTFDKPEASRSDIDRALRVVERIGLVGTARSQLPRQLQGVFTVSKLMGDPSPIAFRIAVFCGLLPGRDGTVEEHGIDRRNIKPEVAGSPDGIAEIFDGDKVRGIVLAIQEAGDAKYPVAVGASGITTESDGKQFERLFLTRKVEVIDAP